MKPSVRVILITTALIASALGDVAGQTFAPDRIWAQAGSVLKSFTPAGALASTSAPVLAGGSWGIAVDGSRNVWVTNYAPGQNTVSKFDPSGNHLGTFTAGAVPDPSESSVGPIAIDAAGNVYVGDPRSTYGAITKLDSQGNFLSIWPAGGNSVRSLVIDSQGNLWSMHYLGGANRVEKFAPDGTFLLSVAEPVTAPNSLYADEWGRILVSHYPAPDRIAMFDLDGNYLGGLVSAHGNHFRAVAVAPDGKIWSNGLFSLEVFNANGTSYTNVPSGSGSLSAIAFDAAGQTWTSSYEIATAPISAARIRLRRRTTFGGLLGESVVGQPPPYGASFNMGDPTGLVRARTIDPNGDIDGDGTPNYVEVVAGSSPLDPASLPTTWTLQSAAYIGGIFRVGISAPLDGFRPYVMAFSTNSGTIPLGSSPAGDPRVVPIGAWHPLNPTLIDPFWELSMSGLWPGSVMFPDTIGMLDFFGNALVRVHIPALPQLTGLTFHGAFVILDSASRSGIKAISTRITTTIL